ncbi:MAG: transporter substrate-binding domain-containing protein [Clostridiales bacterium]|nr:transporter substrate-binding domain-containing protein [Clostridiales bacterium]
MKKKLLSIILASVMVLGLAGCGSSSSSTSESADTSAETADTSAEGASTAETESKGTLTVAMECGYAPYNWTQSDDSNGAVPIKDSSDYAYGYDVMMAKLIAEECGYDLEIVKLDWDSLVPAVQSGTVDCVIAGQSITSDRLEMVDFSDPYYYASIITLVRSDGEYADAQGVSDLAGATCTSQLGTIWYDNCLPQIPDADIQAAQESAPAMLVALNSGRTDVVVTDMPTGKAALVAYPDFTLLDFSGTDDDYEVSEEEINIGISIQKGNTELLDEINSVLAGLTTDDYDEMMDEAISVQPLSE